jgi:hypothetical protein
MCPLWAGCGPEGMSALVVTSIDCSQHTNVEKLDFIRSKDGYDYMYTVRNILCRRVKTRIAKAVFT